MPGRDWARAHPPAVGLRVVHVDAGVAQHRHRHRDMRRRRHRLAGVHDGQPVSERGARQQQAGYELRRGRCVNLDGAARYRSAAVHPERQAVAVDIHTQSAQRGEQRRDGPGAGLLVTVECDGFGAQCGHRWDKAQHRAGQAAVHAGAGRRCDVAADGQLDVGAVDRDAERVQRADHQVGVAAAQRTADGRRSLGRGQRGKHQRPVRLRLRTRHGDRRMDGGRRRGGRPCAHGSILPCRCFLEP